MTNPDLSAAEFSEFASRHTFDEIFDGRATPPAAVVPGTREALEKLLLSAKLLQQNSEACAANHYGGDCETFGLPGWLADTKRDIEAAQAALSAPVPPADADRIALEHAKTRFACLVDHFKEVGEEALCVMSEVDGERMDRGLAAVTSGTGAAEPVAWQALPYATPQELVAAFKSGVKFALHYHGKSFDVTRMEERKRVVYIQPPALPVKVWPNGSSAEGGGDGIWLAALPPVRGDREIIRDFEDVCEKIAATRPQAAYLAMIDGGQGDLLTELDGVRRQARAILSGPAQSSAMVGVSRVIDAEIERWENDARVLYPDAEILESLSRIKIALSSAPVRKYAGNHSVVLQFLFENETDGCPNCRGCAEHRCSSAPEAPPAYVDPDLDKAGNRRYWAHRERASSAPVATVSGEPVVRDTNMFSRLADEPLAVIPEGYSAPLDIRTAAEIQHDRIAAKSSPQDVGREATIEECAKIADTFAAYEQTVLDRAYADTALSVTGRKSIAEAAGSRQVAAEQIAYDIRSLSRKGGER